MRNTGGFLLGFVLSFPLVATLGTHILLSMVGNAQNNPYGGYALIILYIPMLAVAAAIAGGVGILCARYLKARGFSYAGYAITFLILGYLAYSVFEYRRETAENDAQRAVWAEEYEKKQVPIRNAEAKQARQWDLDATEAGMELLCAWMPVRGKIDPTKMGYRDPQPWPVIMVRIDKGKAEEVMARIAPDGWTQRKDFSNEAWQHSNLTRPGDGVPVDVEVSRDYYRTVWLRVVRPGAN